MRLFHKKETLLFISFYIKDRFKLSNIVKFDHLTYHVQSNESHDNHIKFLVCYNSENNGLGTPAGPWKSFYRFFVAGLLHSGDVLLLVLSHEGVQGASAFVLLLIELVDDDADQQVEGEEAAEDDEEDKVHVHVDTGLSMRLFV